ncbi:hypothetical protein ACQP25_24545 [Microtetraspora malaysiensis]|uniref:hypothetical protein n=1 Tax=Microtetraspora malaysiensis TaxID=161358 RepID=UPI003D90C850
MVQAEIVPPGASFTESLGAYLDATLDRPDWARLVVWQVLGDCPYTDAGAGPAWRAGLDGAPRAALRRPAARVLLRMDRL